MVSFQAKQLIASSLPAAPSQKGLSVAMFMVSAKLLLGILGIKAGSLSYRNTIHLSVGLIMFFSFQLKKQNRTNETLSKTSLVGKNKQHTTQIAT